jgi:hypothetical protein
MSYSLAELSHFDIYDYKDDDQYKDDRRLPVPCSVCHGTDKIRFDFINRHSKIINGYVFKPGVNVTYKPCPACQDPDAVQVRYVEPVQITTDPEPEDAARGECKGCKADDVLIDSNGYCFNC